MNECINLDRFDIFWEYLVINFEIFRRNIRFREVKLLGVYRFRVISRVEYR